MWNDGDAVKEIVFVGKRKRMENQRSINRSSFSGSGELPIWSNKLSDRNSKGVLGVVSAVPVLGKNFRTKKKEEDEKEKKRRWKGKAREPETR